MGEAVVTSEKQGNEEPGDKKPKKSKKKYFKVIIRRLPVGMTKEDLLTAIGPLPQHERFWFRHAEEWLDEDALPYAFVVFDDFEQAAKFQRKFDGQILTDSDGKESRIIVEKAANQDFDKNPSVMKSKNKPITEDIGYIKFLEEAENNSTGKKVDFDVLVNEIVERERKLAQGICQETPLTDYFVRQAQSGLKSKKGKGKHDIIESSKKGLKGRQKEKPKNPKELTKKEIDQKKKEYSGNQQKEKKERPSSSMKPKIESKLQKEVNIQEKNAKKIEKQESMDNSQKSTESRKEENSKFSESRKEENSGRTQEQKSEKKPQRNKDRPERPIYQPGKGRRIFNKSASSSKASEDK